MNKSIYYIVLLVFGSMVAFGAPRAKGFGYQGPLKLTPDRLEQVGDSLHLTILFDLDSLKLRNRRAMELIPTLVGSTKKQSLPSVWVRGRIDRLNAERRLALSGKKARTAYEKNLPYADLKGFRSKGKKEFVYSQTLPFRSWMVGARLDIQADLHGCGAAPRVAQFHTMSTVQLEPPIAPYVIAPVLGYVQPAAEPIKRRELVAEAFLDFAVNKTDIRPDYMNNPRELKKITDVLAELYGDSTITIRQIDVVGYASPEGSYVGNRRLSEGRAQALVGYLSPRFAAKRGVYRVSYGGENWQGLKDAVAKLEWFDYREQVVRLLTPLSTEVDAKQSNMLKYQIKAFGGGAPYKLLLAEVYPSLRKAICKIDFVIRGFEADMARRVIKVKPQNLSLNEMFLVANTYANGSKEFVEVFDIAVRLYPNDPTANLNAASAALVRGDVAMAQSYLDRIEGQMPVADHDNVRGVLAMLQGDYDGGETYLRKAAAAGSVAAGANLEQLEKKRENIAQIEMQQQRWNRSDD